jgi:hypothetical protein
MSNNRIVIGALFFCVAAGIAFLTTIAHGGASSRHC